MPTSTTDLVNAGIYLIGGKAITDIGDGSKEANVAGALIDLVRDALLRAHTWNFATGRVIMSRSSSTPLGFDYAYTLPSDWIRTVGVHDNDAFVGTINHAEETLEGENVILASEEVVYLRYIKQSEDPNKWSADFRMLFSEVMSKVMSIPIADSNTLNQVIEDAVKSALRRAKSIDAMSGTPAKRPRGSWADFRSGWR